MLLRSPALLAAGACTALLGAQSPSTNYQALTNPFSNQTNFNVETVRGISYQPGAAEIWAINTHGSLLVRMTKQGSAPLVERFRTLNNPVSLAHWTYGASTMLLVVGGGTHGLAIHSAATGDVVFHANLPSEPRDIVVDANSNLAWVACANEDLVLRIDLVQTITTNQLVATTVAVPGTRPTFLSFEAGASPAQNVVRVTPMLSGNNTTHDGPETFMTVVRLPAAPQPPATSTTSLPDHDLFAITQGGTLTPVLAGAGTLLTAHGRHVNGSYWLLGTEAFNENVDEPDNKGDFAQNRVAIVGSFGSAPQILDLDVTTTPFFPPATLPGEPSPSKPLSFPWDVAFHPSVTFPLAVLSGSTSDTLRIYYQATASSTPLRVKDVALPSGSIPRTLKFDPSGNILWVYCWGTNRVLEFDFNALLSQTTTAWIAEWDLGPDPQPDAVKRGRRTWYDADNSAQLSLTCNHCHPGGGMDMLGWRLSDTPFDHKDVMVTQSLKSLEDTFPYHWRGERNLGDFNGAFSGLLGGSQLGSAALEDFEEFVFSMQVPANPRQNVDRQLVVAGGIDAHAGQADFVANTNRLAAFLGATCVACHGLETGSNGMITQDNGISFVPSNTNMDVSHLRQLDDKLRQPAHAITMGGTGTTRPRGGFGLSHNGDDVGADGFIDPAVFMINATERTQMSEFTRQFDQGIAPRTHEAYLLNTATPLADAAALGLLILNQAAPANPWFGVAVVGRTALGKETQLHRDNGSYIDESGNATTFTNIWNDAQAGGSYLFVFLAPGNARRFAVDPDNDGADTGTELNQSTDPMLADSDGDSFPDGYEIAIGTNPKLTTTLAAVQAADTSAPSVQSAELDFATSRLGRFRVRYSEPVTVAVQLLRRVPNSNPAVFQPVGAPQLHPSRVTEHALVAQELLPSMPVTIGGTPVPDEQYRVQVTITDFANKSKTDLLRDAAQNPIVVSTDDTVLASTGIGFPALTTSNLTVSRPGGAGGPVDVAVQLDDIWDFAAVPFSNSAGAFVVAQVTTIVNGVRTLQTPTALGATSIVPTSQLNASIASVIPGATLVSPAAVTTVGGTSTTTLSFSLGVATNTTVIVSILGVAKVDPRTPPDSLRAPDRAPIWFMPMSPMNGRTVQFQY